jgi:hypothetical protein
MCLEYSRLTTYRILQLQVFWVLMYQSVYLIMDLNFVF